MKFAFLSTIVLLAYLCGADAEIHALPSGHGLAQAYPYDQDLTSHPAVIFAETFEDPNYAERWDEVRDHDEKVLALVHPEDHRLGEAALQVRGDLAHNTGGGLTKWFASAPTVYIRFYTKFAPDADYIHHFVTLRANKGLQGKDRWSGFGGAGNLPDGDLRFSTALEPWGNWGKWPAPGRWNFYSYWHEMEASPDGKYWGNSFKPEEVPNITKGEWICCEFMLKHNTPGVPDGEQAFWIDGKLLGHWKDISWRTSPTLWANALTLEAYITDRWTKHPINRVTFDNLVVARDYIGPVVTEPAEPTDFVRFVDQPDQATLEVASVSYGREDGVTVDLVGAVHVGDAAYYAMLNERFRAYDRVLYEMVGDPNAAPPVEVEAGATMVRGMQRGMMRLLDLAYQLDAIDYTPENFVHADLTYEEFSKLQEERGETMFTLIQNAMKRQLEMDPEEIPEVGVGDLFRAFTGGDQSSALKLLVAKQFDEMESLLAGAEEGSGTVILTGRNERVIDILNEQIEEGEERLAIFYGAAHFVGIEELLLELGFHKKSHEWMVAWDIPKPEVKKRGSLLDFFQF